jgi:hypothetical protein
MSGDNRLIFDDDSYLADRRSRDDDVHPIGEVLAELLGQYRVEFPDSQQILPRFSLSLWDRPRPFSFVLPEQPTGMDKEDLKGIAPDAIH